jgi:hypothetical protein
LLGVRRGNCYRPMKRTQGLKMIPFRRRHDNTIPSSHTSCPGLVSDLPFPLPLLLFFIHSLNNARYPASLLIALLAIPSLYCISPNTPHSFYNTKDDFTLIPLHQRRHGGLSLFFPASESNLRPRRGLHSSDQRIHEWT